ncbi:MAG: hypothetical protein V1782_11900 [Pseudomonadota bacterium]
MQKKLVQSECLDCQVVMVGENPFMMLCPKHSAAPELLEALRDCLRHIEIGEGHKAGDFECVLAARAAIAVAEA